VHGLFEWTSEIEKQPVFLRGYSWSFSSGQRVSVKKTHISFGGNYFNARKVGGGCGEDEEPGKLFSVVGLA